VKTIGLEEHFVTADVLQAWGQLEPQYEIRQGYSRETISGAASPSWTGSASPQWRTPGSTFKFSP
jgi:hypothetical protein